MPDITCPSCDTTTFVEQLGRNSDSFCPTCDRPLFLGPVPVAAEVGAGTADTAAVGEQPADDHLRRLPGAGGRTRLATRSCPQCDENNPADLAVCLRCGAELYPTEPVPLPPEPVAVVLPDPVEEEPGWGAWILVAIMLMFLVGIAVWAFVTM